VPRQIMEETQPEEAAGFRRIGTELKSRRDPRYHLLPVIGQLRDSCGVRPAKPCALQAEAEGPAWLVNVPRTPLGHSEQSEESLRIQQLRKQGLKLNANRNSELLANILTHSKQRAETISNRKKMRPLGRRNGRCQNQVAVSTRFTQMILPSLCVRHPEAASNLFLERTQTGSTTDASRCIHKKVRQED
jgi:hypothetical protein